MNLRKRPVGIFENIMAGLWDREIGSRFPNCAFQCGLATVSLIIILLLEDAVFHAAIIVAVGSTAFVVFIVPDSVAATPRRVIGGHAVAVVCGTVFAFALQISALASMSEGFPQAREVAAALAVGISIFLMGLTNMGLTNTEHPPAAGTALGLLIPDWSISAVAFILISALVLSIVRIILRPKLINLL